MVKHTRTVRRLLPTNCLSVFGHFVGLVLKGLKLVKMICNMAFWRQNVLLGYTTPISKLLIFGSFMKFQLPLHGKIICTPPYPYVNCKYFLLRQFSDVMLTRGNAEGSYKCERGCLYKTIDNVGDRYQKLK